MTDRTEHVPEAAVERARSLFGRRGPGELAALMHDSLVDGEGTAESHVLQFEHARMRIDVQVSVGATTRLTGTVHPPRALEVRLEVEGSDAVPQVDAPDGTFSLESVSHGSVRLHLTGPAETTPVHTDWFRI
ncbi:MAG: hypothetical protein J2P57_02225 [Acidimicrobiaceae bacterium]|nr:hypothetical protein [Acidimicrobiaceae bacterium]